MEPWVLQEGHNMEHWASLAPWIRGQNPVEVVRGQSVAGPREGPDLYLDLPEHWEQQFCPIWTCVRCSDWWIQQRILEPDWLILVPWSAAGVDQAGLVADQCWSWHGSQTVHAVACIRCRWSWYFSRPEHNLFIHLIKKLLFFTSTSSTAVLNFFSRSDLNLIKLLPGFFIASSVSSEKNLFLLVQSVINLLNFSISSLLATLVKI